MFFARKNDIELALFISSSFAFFVLLSRLGGVLNSCLLRWCELRILSPFLIRKATGEIISDFCLIILAFREGSEITFSLTSPTPPHSLLQPWGARIKVQREKENLSQREKQLTPWKFIRLLSSSILPRRHRTEKTFSLLVAFRIDARPDPTFFFLLAFCQTIGFDFFFASA